MMALIFTEEGKEFEVVSIEGGVNAFKKLKEMGIYPGVKIKVISVSNGPVIIGLGNTRIAIGRGIASKIMVKEIGKL
jgi:ferrous iron transport protein A